MPVWEMEGMIFGVCVRDSGKVTSVQDSVLFP